MGQIKNIKLHIVTDIKGKQVSPNLAKTPTKQQNGQRTNLHHDQTRRSRQKPGRQNRRTIRAARLQTGRYEVYAGERRTPSEALRRPGFKTFLRLPRQAHRIWTRRPNGMGRKGCRATGPRYVGRDGPLEIQARFYSW